MNGPFRAARLGTHAVVFGLPRHVLISDDAEALLVVIEDFRAEKNALPVALTSGAVDSNFHGALSCPFRVLRDVAA